MKSLIIVAMLSLLTACATSVPTNTNVPKTSLDNQPSQTMRVMGKGKTVEEAKMNGFRDAIEFIVGSVIVTETDAKNGQLVRDDIINHSAGYVDDYKIISESSSQGKVLLVMDVTVKHSKIAHKLLNRNGSPTDMNGDKLNAQYQTYMVERGTGDQLLNTVLKDYPFKAFTATPGKIDFMVSSHRESIIVIPYSLKWNYSYLESLNEALSKLEDGTDANYFNAKCMCYKAPERIVVMSKDPKSWVLGSKKNYYFNDSLRVDHVRNTIDAGNNIRISVYDYENTVIHTECRRVGPTFAGRLDKNVLTFWGNEVDTGVLHVTVKNDKSLGKNLSTANRIELSMDTDRGCKR